MNYRLTVMHDTSRSRSDPSAYRVTVKESVDPLCSFRQHGDVRDNWARYIGVYPTKREAFQIATNYTGLRRKAMLGRANG